MNGQAEKIRSLTEEERAQSVRSEVGEVLNLQDLKAELVEARKKIAELSEQNTDLTSKLEKEEARNYELEKQARYDKLTGVFNRGEFEIHAQEVLASAMRHKRKTTVLMLDIDFFKQVNDTYGHLLGDEVLRAVAQAIESAKRSEDIVGRYGGEEFSMVLPETDASGAEVVAERIRCSIEQLKFSNPDIKTSISIGGYSTVPIKGDDLNNLINSADAALYRAKNEGRNRVVFAE